MASRKLSSTNLVASCAASVAEGSAVRTVRGVRQPRASVSMPNSAETRGRFMTASQ